MEYVYPEKKKKKKKKKKYTYSNEMCSDLTGKSVTILIVSLKLLDMQRSLSSSSAANDDTDGNSRSLLNSILTDLHTIEKR